MLVSPVRQPAAGTQSGYSLLEVLIALLVFSVGLLGLAAMMVSAVRGNHQAYYRSQAVNVAEAVADGLRANLAAVNAGDYDTGGFVTSHDGSACASACSAAQLADRDLSSWAAMMQDRLPNGAINIGCERQAAPVDGILAASFNGTCTIRLRWSEVGDVGQTATATQTIFTWMVQP